MDAKLQSGMWCCAYGGGIIFTLCLYGIVQERVMSQPYDGEFFTVSLFLVLCNRLVAILYAVSMAATQGEQFRNTAPLWKYLAVSFSNVAATWCQYEALKYVSFPVQMLGKSFKMMPVMLWGIVISQKRYGVKDWLIAAGVTGGVTMFLLTGSIKSKHGDQESSFYGILLLAAFLFCDGFTSTFQEKLFKQHSTSKYNQMMYVNGGSSVVALGSLLLSGGAPTALSFCTRHPSFGLHALSLSGTAVGGQFFIYSQVKEFGALVFAATMNLRQVVSILNSYIMYQHPINLLQIVALTVVFGTLFFKSYLGYRSAGEGKDKAKASADAQAVPDVEAAAPSLPATVVGRVEQADGEEPEEARVASQGTTVAQRS